MTTPEIRAGQEKVEQPAQQEITTYFNLPELTDFPEVKIGTLKLAVQEINRDISGLPGTSLQDKQNLGKIINLYIKKSCDLAFATNLKDYERVFPSQAILEHYLSEEHTLTLWKQLH